MRANDASVTITELGVTVQTNSDGLYTFTAQKEGTYLVVASKTNYMDRTETGIIDKNNVSNLDFILLGISGSIAVMVISNGVPLANVNIVLDTSIQSIFTDAGGLCELANVSPGNHNVMATAVGKQVVSMPVNVGLNSTVSIVFDLVDI
jgi:hypothetical protein